MSKTRLTLVSVCLLIGIPLTSSGAQSSSSLSSTCRSSRESQPGYLSYHLSPKQSFRDYDTVFFGEVVVPARPCSLGHCAGVRVKRKLKGDLSANILLQVMRPQEHPCGPRNFNEPGQTWLVFANRGTSKTGISYHYADDEGPSFQTLDVPDLEQLERHYVAQRSQLDRAIEATVGPVRMNGYLR